MIKYKGQTSIILKDLSLALNLPVQLKASEEILCKFFSYIMNTVPREKAIILLSQLPPSVKVFCRRKTSTDFSPESEPKMVRAIIQVLDRHIQAEHLIHVYSCFPDFVFQHSPGSKNPYANEIKSKNMYIRV